MEFRLSEEQEELRESVRRYASERLLDIAEEIEQSGEPPSHELVAEFADMGYLGINIAEQHGGAGLGNLEALLVIEELGKISSAVAFPPPSLKMSNVTEKRPSSSAVALNVFPPGAAMLRDVPGAAVPLTVKPLMFSTMPRTGILT